MVTLFTFCLLSHTYICFKYNLCWSEYYLVAPRERLWLGRIKPFLYNVLYRWNGFTEKAPKPLTSLEISIIRRNFYGYFQIVPCITKVEYKNTTY